MGCESSQPQEFRYMGNVELRCMGLYGFEKLLVEENDTINWENKIRKKRGWPKIPPNPHYLEYLERCKRGEDAPNPRLIHKIRELQEERKRVREAEEAEREHERQEREREERLSAFRERKRANKY